MVSMAVLVDRDVAVSFHFSHWVQKQVASVLNPILQRWILSFMSDRLCVTELGLFSIMLKVCQNGRFSLIAVSVTVYYTNFFIILPTYGDSSTRG